MLRFEKQEGDITHWEFRILESYVRMQVSQHSWLNNLWTVTNVQNISEQPKGSSKMWPCRTSRWFNPKESSNIQCVHEAVTDLITQLNGKLTKKEKSIVKQIANMQIQQVDGKNKFDVCEVEDKEKENLCEHWWKSGSDCNMCQIEIKNIGNSQEP